MPVKKKTTTSKTPVKKAAAKKSAVKKPVAKKTTPKKPAAKKTVAKKPVAKKPAAKKTVAKKATTAKKAVVKKTTTKKTTTMKKAPVKKPVAKAPAVKKTTVVKKAPAPKKSAAEKGAAVAVIKEEVNFIDEKPVRKVAEKAISKQAVGSGFMGIPPYKIKKGEEYLGEEQKAHFMNILTTWRDSLLEEAGRTVNYMQDEAANFPDPNDRATQEEEFNLELRTRDRERRLIKKIDGAIIMLSEDEYGYCEMCGVEIGIRRLEARPTAKLCIDCKTMSEIREKQGVY